MTYMGYLKEKKIFIHEKKCMIMIIFVEFWWLHLCVLPMIGKTEFGYNSRLMSSYKEHLIHVWGNFGGTSILFSVFFHFIFE